MGRNARLRPEAPRGPFGDNRVGVGPERGLRSASGRVSASTDSVGCGGRDLRDARSPDIGWTAPRGRPRSKWPSPRRRRSPIPTPSRYPFTGLDGSGGTGGWCGSQLCSHKHIAPSPTRRSSRCSTVGMSSRHHEHRRRESCSVSSWLCLGSLAINWFRSANALILWGFRGFGCRG